MKQAFLIAIAGLLLTPGVSQAQYVRLAPPPQPVEHRSPQPDSRFVWVSGYQRWDGHAYHWAPGKWVIPPRPHAFWVAGRWDARAGGYVWVPGHWRD